MTRTDVATYVREKPGMTRSCSRTALSPPTRAASTAYGARISGLTAPPRDGTRRPIGGVATTSTTSAETAGLEISRRMTASLRRQRGGGNALTIDKVRIALELVLPLHDHGGDAQVDAPAQEQLAHDRPTSTVLPRPTSSAIRQLQRLAQR
jgi:hypothetical protein